MTRATPDNCPNPRTIADGDDQTVDVDVLEFVETASTLIAMRNIPFDITEKEVDESKSNATKRSQQVKGNVRLCYDKPTNETTPFDAMKLFSDEELKGLLEIVKVEDDCLEVVCACTSKMHGHYVGHLKVFRDGNLLIDCKCIPGCDIENATPEQFVSHARARLGPSEWPRCIWVYDQKGGRTLLKNSPLLRHFEIAGLKVEKRSKFRIHRDEFMECMKCGIERRFKLRSKEECREYHEAFLMKDIWTCSQHPRDKIECGTEGERATRKLVRGCTRNGTCRGCSMCACYGCLHCRFSDCGCRLCMDFTGRSKMEVDDATSQVI